MSLSPNDIRNYEFPTQMRGYDKEEVDSLLDQVATALENMKQETLKLSMENDSVKSQLESLKKYEDSIKGAAIDARQNADSTMSNAKEEANKILADAQITADNLVSSKEEMISEYKKQLNRLEETKNSFSLELKDMINVHLSMISKISTTQFSYDSESNNDDTQDVNSNEPIEVTNSSEVERNQMNTVGTESTDEQIVTEEANAAGEIVPASEDTPIDPELAAALSGYAPNAPKTEDVTPDTMIGADVVPKPGEFVETNKRAEDVPEGFIVGSTVDEPQKASTSQTTTTNHDEVDTGKLDMAPDAQDENSEHNNISIDDPSTINPENIVNELDNVVAKFEKEMDKAESK